ncbi:GntR family transcriptional regulator [Bacillus salipaludis]|uniref:GntR family transcriptional regulator n=1 Tax=Bacillus salipaludis TaxID=2547811 RepID=UPI003D1A6981
MDKSIPLYRQLKEKILKQSKDQSPLTPIPSERELCDLFGVSRPTVRRALEELEQDGEVYRLAGKGTFIADKKYTDHELQSFIGFHEDASQQNKTPTSMVLQQIVTTAPVDVAKVLEIPEDSEVFLLERLRFVDNEPICLVSSYIPLHICPDLIRTDFSERSLYKFLNLHNISIHKAKRSIEVKKAPTRESTYLNIDLDSPMVLFQSLGFTENGSPFEFVQSRYPAYKARFESEVYRPHEM